MRILQFRSLPLALLLLVPACSSGQDGYVVLNDDSYPGEVQTEVIDIGPGLESTPGEGVGLNIDVAEGGIWRMATTCATKKDGFTCAWDLVASVDPDDGALESVDESTFEDQDQTIRVDPSALRIYLETGEDEDFVELQAPEGATLTLDVILDGYHSNWSAAAEQPPIKGMIAFVSRGSTRLGARSNPVAFEPAPPP